MTFEPPKSVKAALDAAEGEKAASLRAGIPWCDVHEESMIDTPEGFACKRCEEELATATPGALKLPPPRPPETLFGVTDDPQTGEVKISMPTDPRDAAAGNAQREEAIARVTNAAPDDWVEVAYRCLRELLNESRITLTTDDIWARLARGGVKPPPERRAMAAVVRRAEREGLIIKTDDFIRSSLPWAHRRNTQVWKVAR